MGRVVACLLLAVVGFFLLRSTGLLDGMTDRGNLEERDAFWRTTVEAEAPKGASKAAVEAFASRHGVTLECFSPSLDPPVTECRGDDPASKGGTSGHPVALQLGFTFHGDGLTVFETSRRVLR